MQVMQRSDIVRIIHLHRVHGASVFLHPFQHKTSMVGVVGPERMQGLYGEDPAVERFSELRRHLHRIAEKDAAQWVLDQRFVTRFVLSGAVFLSVFVVSSVVLRIPVPIVDDLLIALGSAIACYFFLARRDTHSRTTRTKVNELRHEIDHVRFEHSSTVASVEAVLRRFDTSNPEEILHELKHIQRTRPVLSAVPQVVEEEKAVIDDLRRYLTDTLRRKRMYSCRRIIEKWMRKPESATLTYALRKLRKKEADIALVALLVYLDHARVTALRLAPSPSQDS